MDEKMLAEYALRFMERVQLQGAEVPAFSQVVNWLNGIAALPAKE